VPPSSKEIALDLAAFLDSEQARRLEGPKPADVRKIAEAFLSVCYDGLGKKPRLLDGHDAHEALGHLLPAHFRRGDPLAEHVPAVLSAWLDHLELSETVTQSFELRRGLEGSMDEFLETVRTGKSAHHHAPAPQDPFVHGAPKLGRNDPCSCGSGKKYKKCHGRPS
jgi:hypothetical protein